MAPVMWLLGELREEGTVWGMEKGRVGEGQVEYGVQWRGKHGPEGSQHFRGKYESTNSPAFCMLRLCLSRPGPAQQKWFFLKFRKITFIMYLVSE